MIVAIATIAENVNEGATLFALFVKFNIAAVNRRLLLEACFFSTYRCRRRRERLSSIDFGFERPSRSILLSETQCILVFLLSLRSLERFPYDRYDR